MPIRNISVELSVDDMTRILGALEAYRHNTPFKLLYDRLSSHAVELGVHSPGAAEKKTTTHWSSSAHALKQAQRGLPRSG